MTNTFETTLANVKGQESIFKDRDERAVEIAAVLPLLREVGWNTADLSEIYPQHGLSGGGIVDYDLQIDGESRILIEVKSWKTDLDDKDETQLREYCKSAKPRPKLAVLTNGRVWRLYLAPTAATGKNSVLHRFDEVDITAADIVEVESTFWRFLARDSMVDFKPTLSAAKDLYRKLQDYQEQKKLLTEAWSELTNDKDMLAKLVLEFAENKNITTSQDNVVRFLNSLPGDLVNEVPSKPRPLMPPASFAILASPTGQKKMPHAVESPIGWNQLLLQICKLMQERHSESFRQNILTMTGWFAEAEDKRYKIPVGDAGIYARWENAAVNIREVCYEIVIKFGYPQDSLVIKDSNGQDL